MALNTDYLAYGDAVRQALEAGQPVVALESTILAHGMPFPRNVETALALEAEVRAYGATPATIGVVEGKLTAGLSSAEIERMGKAGNQIPKVSRRDLPILAAQRKTGATTVAATMIIAEMAGIRVFATGGIGGVHRGASATMDISADLQELARTNVAVICAGAKSILDLELTLEYLETHGVPVLGYQTDVFPAFYTRSSGLGVDARIDEPEGIARILQAKWGMGLRGGVVVANPIPESYAMEPEPIEAAIQEALQEAERAGIKGKAITPFLLARIEQLTGGASLEANVQLVLNNARLAARIVVELSLPPAK